MNKLYYYIIFLFSILILSICINPDNDNKVTEPIIVNIQNSEGCENVPKSIVMYESIEKYSEMYNVPKYIAYNIAFKETRYRGPFHFNYNPEQNGGGALGPMQITLGTANSKVFTDSSITQNDLLTNIELNIELSMKILKRSYDIHKSWKIACGKYNTGQAIINDYAIYCSTNKDYIKNWINLK